MCTSYSGAIIRTTHMTGCMTDIGLVCGQELRIRVMVPMELWLRNTFTHYKPLEDTAQNTAAGSTTTAVSSDKEVSIVWRLKVLLPLLSGYLVGSLVGALCYIRF